MSIKSAIKSLDPDLVIHAGAYTKVDLAEKEKDLCEKINRHSVDTIVRSLKSTCPIIYFSTEHVYGVDHTSQITRDSATNPLNHYAKTKLAGEQVIKQSDIPYIIFRTSWVFGKGGANFVDTILNLSKSRKKISVVCDQVGSPTSSTTIASVIDSLITNAKKDFVSFFLKNKGVYHLCDSGETSWANYAQTIVAYARKLNISLLLEEIEFIKSSQYKTLAVRPLNSRMCCKETCKVFSVSFDSWKDSLWKYMSGLK